MQSNPHNPKSDSWFFSGMFFLGGFYLLLIVALLAADMFYAATRMSWDRITAIFSDPGIQASIKLTVVSCTLSALFSLIVAIPLGFLMSRSKFKGKSLIDALIDVPIVLPPLVIGLSLLILFSRLNLDAVFVWMFQWMLPEGVKAGVTYKVPAVILAQFTVACAFAVRAMRITFDDIDPRPERVALTLGSSRSQAFWAVILPQAWRGALTAYGLAWARSMGEFGPILVFAAAMEFRTEVLSTSVFLDISIGNIEGAVTISLLMVAIAMLVIMAIRFNWGAAIRSISGNEGRVPSND